MQVNKRTQGHSHNSWLIRFSASNQARVRLICFPYAGGNANVFRNWGGFSKDLEVIAVQYPGRATRFSEPLIDSMDDMLDKLLDALAEVVEDEVPFIFFGHSMGASIAFELCRLMQKKKLPMPDALIVSGRRAPSFPKEDNKPLIHALDQRAFFEKIKALNGTPNELLENDDLMNLMEPILRSDFKLVETHQYKQDEALNIPVYVFSGENDQHVNDENIQAWQDETKAACEFISLPGDHFFLHSQESLLLKKLTAITHSYI